MLYSRNSIPDQRLNSNDDTGEEQELQEESTNHLDTGYSDMYCDRDSTSIAFCSSEEHGNCNQHPTGTCEDAGSVEEESNEDSDKLSAEKQNIIRALVKGLMLVEQMEGSITDFEDVLAFSKNCTAKMMNI